MTDQLPRSAFARSFGSKAAEYAAHRPSYPAVAVEAALAGVDPLRSVLDLGAGTGKLTELLTGRGFDVAAVEPDPNMLAVLDEVAPQARALAGSAERIPLPDASVDVILVGQAFHWFPRPDADREMARVLRPGGVVGLLWNFPDQTAAEWVPKIYEATRQLSAPESSDDRNLTTELFTEPDERWFPSAHDVAGAAGLRDLIHTWSWVITRSQFERDAIDQRLRVLVSQYADLQGPVVRIPQRTKLVLQGLR